MSTYQSTYSRQMSADPATGGVASGAFRSRPYPSIASPVAENPRKTRPICRASAGVTSAGGSPGSAVMTK
jgi:hypothetical protein